MVKKSAENSPAAIAPFLTKCYDMVDDESTDEAISWSQNGNSFVIWNMTHFTVHLLPNYFKHGNFSSFMRQLNIYGFRKIDSDRWEFANDGFIRGQKHLLRSIVRRKHSSGLNQHKSSSPCDDIEDTENNLHVIWNEVESLKTDRNALTQELDKLRQHHESTKNRVLLLGERLQLMEKNQQQLLSFLVMVMQSPSFFLQLLQQKENTWRVPKTGKNMLEEVNGDGEPADGMIVRYQPLMEMDGPPAPALEEVSGQEPSESNFWFEKAKDFFTTKPGDGQFSFMENHGSFGLPDLADDTILKQIILGSPLRENNISSNWTDPDSEEPEGPAQVDRFLTLESLSEEMEKSEQLESKENSRNLDLLTEQLGLLISGSANV